MAFVVLCLLGNNLVAQTPLAPTMNVVSLDRAALITWDSLAEKSSSIPFSGYRLYRGRVPEGPFQKIREWRAPTVTAMVRSYFDYGDDNEDGTLSANEGLRNDLVYYYRVSAFADSVVSPYRPFSETPSQTIIAKPHTTPTNYMQTPISLGGQKGILGDLDVPALLITSQGNFRQLFEGHSIAVSITTSNAGNVYVFPITVRDSTFGFTQTFILNPGLLVTGDSSRPGLRQDIFLGENIFAMNAFALQLPWKFTQYAGALHVEAPVTNPVDTPPDTPILYRDTAQGTVVGLRGYGSTLGESKYEIEFLAGGVDTVNAASKQLYNYLALTIAVKNQDRSLQPAAVSNFATQIGQWSLTGYAFNVTTSGTFPITKRNANKYYYRTEIDSATVWEFSNVISMENTRIALDYARKGRGPTMNWPYPDYKATRDFKAGDKITVTVAGGVGGRFPYNAECTYNVGQAAKTKATEDILDQIRIVPNPYLIRHEAQQSPRDPRLRFDYLPEECDISIYTVALEVVKVLRHRTGSVEYWDMTNKNGRRIASQLLIARIEAPGGASVIKKFAVILGE